MKPEFVLLGLTTLGVGYLAYAAYVAQQNTAATAAALGSTSPSGYPAGSIVYVNMASTNLTTQAGISQNETGGTPLTVVSGTVTNGMIQVTDPMQNTGTVALAAVTPTQPTQAQQTAWGVTPNSATTQNTVTQLQGAGTGGSLQAQGYSAGALMQRGHGYALQVTPYIPAGGRAPGGIPGRSLMQRYPTHRAG
jgi:hypothetical protein